MENTTTISKGEIWPIEKVRPWDKNPRQIGPEDFERLKAQIKKLGIYKPLIVTPDGTILGGNMRYRALKELGQPQVWVSIVEPKDEAQMLEYALSDNDAAGNWNRDKLAEMATLLPIEAKLYKISSTRLLPLEDLKKQYGPDGDNDPPKPPDPIKPISTFGKLVTCPGCGEQFEISTSGKDVDNT